MPNLPIAVHFIAQTPNLDVMRLGAAVFDAPIAILRPGRPIAISTRVRALYARVPRLIAIMGSVPALRHQRTNSSVPNAFGSSDFQADLSGSDAH